jgi:hypothetical protein
VPRQSLSSQSHWGALEEPFAPGFPFEHTVPWQVLQTEIEQRALCAWDPAIKAALERQGAYEAVETEALLSLLADEVLRDEDGPADPLVFPRAAAKFRRRHGLPRAEI